MLHVLEKLVEIADDTGDAKDYNFAGQQGSRFYDMLNISAVEKADIADRIEAAASKLHDPKPSRRAMRAKDVEAKLAAAKETSH